MGPLFVLIFWIIIGSLLSAIGGGLLACAVAFLLRGVEVGRKRAILLAGLLPAIGFAYLFVCVLLFSFWSAARGRDWGWGDTWDTPILDNYHLMMIDVTDDGTVYNHANPAVYHDGGVAGSPQQQDVVFGVRRLEVRPPYILGAASEDQSFPRKPAETLFFILDTRTGLRTDLPSLSALEAAAQKLGGPLKLKPVEAIYNRYRYGIVDLIPITLFAIPPLIALFFLMRMTLRLRATRELAARG